MNRNYYYCPLPKKGERIIIENTNTTKGASINEELDVIQANYAFWDRAIIVVKCKRKGNKNASFINNKNYQWRVKGKEPEKDNLLNQINIKLDFIINFLRERF